MFSRVLLALPVLSLFHLQTFATPVAQFEDLGGLFKDLKNLQAEIRINTRELVQDILNGGKSGQSEEVEPKPTACTGTCCIWYDVSAELTRLFKTTNGECNEFARGAVRLGFHDAGTWDPVADDGGADGSFLMDFGEHERRENNGLQSIRKVLRDLQARFSVGFADLAQYAHNHATVSCPRGPRIRTFVGRTDATKAAPVGRLPDTHDAPENLIKMFEEKGFTARDLVALLGAHTAATQRFVDQSRTGQLDRTPGVWDVDFYNETLANPAPRDYFVLPSDKALSAHPQTSNAWNGFVDKQLAWNAAYSRAYIRMSLLGVKNVSSLVDCTVTLPKETGNGGR
ncbi:ligninase LG6 precursor [Dendryphion nanum]|uniref:Peroxidase n=1 Tax=Dendryphion nanum TaxID=256645 RepID=A0A9P9CZS4_9PLEO|nr:ligninase LG6 precursor [Dendryphion nanum]